MLKGLPASGKSTYAKELIAKGWKRVNKDDLRSMVDDGKWSKEKEKEIVRSEVMLVDSLLTDGFNVVVDDTNFHYEEMWKEIADKYNFEFEVKYFDVPLQECIKRDAKRGDKSVGEKVIFRMWERYCKPVAPAYNPTLPDCYIFDMDGTLSKFNGRGPHDYDKVLTDIQNEDIVRIFNTLNDRDTQMIIVSARVDSCQDDTEQWIGTNLKFQPNELLMRKTGDDRNDSIVKREIYDEFIKDKYNVLGIFDDRDRVVEMWRGIGLTCLQVGYGNF